jgi:CheY-like chemotaxis protein
MEVDLICELLTKLVLWIYCLSLFRALPMNAHVILHAEDDANDAFFVQNAVARAKLDLTLCQVRNGQEAVDYLEGTGPYSDRRAFPEPELLLLDLKMPVLNGFDVLAWVRSQPRFHDLPVFVLSSSEYEEDQQRAKQMGATGYLIKTPDFQNVIRTLSNLRPASVMDHAGQPLGLLHRGGSAQVTDVPGSAHLISVQPSASSGITTDTRRQTL